MMNTKSALLFDRVLDVSQLVEMVVAAKMLFQVRSEHPSPLRALSAALQMARITASFNF